MTDWDVKNEQGQDFVEHVIVNKSDERDVIDLFSVL
jgi:hypothetical protein